MPQEEGHRCLTMTSGKGLYPLRRRKSKREGPNFSNTMQTWPLHPPNRAARQHIYVEPAARAAAAQVHADR
jgi:hypothetical protein